MMPTVFLGKTENQGGGFECLSLAAAGFSP